MMKNNACLYFFEICLKKRTFYQVLKTNVNIECILLTPYANGHLIMWDILNIFVSLGWYKYF